MASVFVSTSPCAVVLLMSMGCRRSRWCPRRQPGVISVSLSSIFTIISWPEPHNTSQDIWGFDLTHAGRHACHHPPSSISSGWCRPCGDPREPRTLIDDGGAVDVEEAVGCVVRARFTLPVAKKIPEVTDKRVYPIYRKISRSKLKQKIPNFSRKLYKLSLKHLILRTST
jgi:hypothetical protein